MTLYDVIFVSKLQIPSVYNLEDLWTKLAPDLPLTRVFILNCGQLDKMKQVLSDHFES